METMRNCFYRLKVLYKIRNYLDVDLRIRLCDSLILSKLNYADTVFGPYLLNKTKRTIQRIQNACARFCFPIPRWSHVSPYLNGNKLMNMAERRTLHLATLLFGLIKCEQPSYLFEKLKFSDRRIRSAPRLVYPQHRAAGFRGSFRFAATKCWNDIPPPLRNLKSVVTFKFQLKKYLLDKQCSGS